MADGEPVAWKPTRPTARSISDGSRGEHSAGVGEQQGQPSWAVVDPLGGLDRRAVDAERRGDALDRVLVDRTGAQEGGAPNASRSPLRRTRISPAAHSWTISPRRVRRAACSEPGVARAERRVTGERQLATPV